ncbi:hypothetical protein MLD38_010461 [Melastoma candidum]|uniref:Uncharacterized protein n=1 Tax=Melastoma candidum TaxID=119954 RepID=A0ACB9R169_9MYRT|nr:hypothetical protein MLD38_010461 [Melastoma candidum]
MDILLAVICSCLVCCSYQVYRFFSPKTCTDGPLPPGPRPFPVIGNLLSLGRLPHKSLHDISRTYGPIIRLSLGRINTVVVSSPSLVRDILHTNDSCFYNRFVPDALTAFDHNKLGLGFVPVSPMFKTLRRIYNTHIFSARKLDGNRHLREENLRRLVEEVATCAEDGRAVNIGEAAFGTAFNLLANMVFSANMVDSCACSKAGELRELVTNILTEAGSPNIADYFPVLKRWDPQGSKRRMEVYFQKMFDIFRSMIESRMDARMERGWRRKDDVLETLLDLCQDKHEEAVDVVLLKHLFLDVFAAGTDTTSNTLEMHYLHTTIAETLRLSPPVPVDPNICFSDNTLPEGFSMKKGDMIHPESSFKFTASRAGPRVCLGKDFAYRQMKILLAILLGCFHFHLADEKQPVLYRTTIALHINEGLSRSSLPQGQRGCRPGHSVQSNTLLRSASSGSFLSAAASAVYNNYTVDGNSGWFFDEATNTSSANYSAWAANQTFNLGDYLLFNTNSNQTAMTIPVPLTIEGTNYFFSDGGPFRERWGGGGPEHPWTDVFGENARDCVDGWLEEDDGLSQLQAYQQGKELANRCDWFSGFSLAFSVFGFEAAPVASVSLFS